MSDPRTLSIGEQEYTLAVTTTQISIVPLGAAESQPEPPDDVPVDPPSIEPHPEGSRIVDATVTRKPDSAFTMQLRQGVNIVNNKHLFPANAAGTARLVKHLPQLYRGICLHMSEGFGVNVAWIPHPEGSRDGTLPPKPNNWASFQNQLAFIARIGLPTILNLYCPPWWMRASGTTRMTAADAYKHNGRLMTSMVDKWQLMVEEGVTIFATAMLAMDAHATIWLDMNNEWKMFQEIRRGDTRTEGQRWADGDYAGTPGEVGDMDFPFFARITLEAALRATTRLGIPRERVRVGGSYPVITFQAGQNADSVAKDHPLYARPYGTLRKVAINAFTRYLAYFRTHNLPLDFLSIDGSTRNRDLVALADDFTNCVRFREVGELARNLATQHGYGDLEIMWKEWYAKPQGRGADNRQLDAVADTPQVRGLVKVRALMEMALGGAGAVYAWGWEGEGDDPGTVSNGATLHGVDRADGGNPTPIFTLLRLFQDTFPAGTRAYALAVDGAGISGLATDTKVMLLNETPEPRRVAVDGEVVELEPWAVRVVS